MAAWEDSGAILCVGCDDSRTVTDAVGVKRAFIFIESLYPPIPPFHHLLCTLTPASSQVTAAPGGGHQRRPEMEEGFGRGRLYFETGVSAGQRTRDSSFYDTGSWNLFLRGLNFNL